MLYALFQMNPQNKNEFYVISMLHTTNIATNLSSFSRVVFFMQCKVCTWCVYELMNSWAHLKTFTIWIYLLWLFVWIILHLIFIHTFIGGVYSTFSAFLCELLFNEHRVTVELTMAIASICDDATTSGCSFQDWIGMFVCLNISRKNETFY